MFWDGRSGVEGRRWRVSVRGWGSGKRGVDWEWRGGNKW